MSAWRSGSVVGRISTKLLYVEPPLLSRLSGRLRRAHTTSVCNQVTSANLASCPYSKMGNEYRPGRRAMNLCGIIGMLLLAALLQRPEAPLKLVTTLYMALYKCVYYYYYYFLTPVLNSQGMEKLRYAIQKSTIIITIIRGGRRAPRLK